MHKLIHSVDAPKAVGPYSHAVSAQGSEMIFLSGQIPFNPTTMQIEATDIRGQTQAVLKNLMLVLSASGVSLQNVVKTTVFLKDLNDFSSMNEEYQRFFGDHKPARTCVEVARLPRDVLVEIDAIAVK